MAQDHSKGFKVDQNLGNDNLPRDPKSANVHTGDLLRNLFQGAKEASHLATDIGQLAKDHADVIEKQRKGQHETPTEKLEHQKHYRQAMHDIQEFCKQHHLFKDSGVKVMGFNVDEKGKPNGIVVEDGHGHFALMNMNGKVTSPLNRVSDGHGHYKLVPPEKSAAPTDIKPSQVKPPPNVAPNSNQEGPYRG